jgi:hypothetical protein
MFSSGQLFLDGNWRTYQSLLVNNLSWCPLFFIIIGVIGLVFNNKWREALFLLIGWGVQTIFALNYKVGDFIVFFTTGFVFLGLLSGIGIAFILHQFDWAAMQFFNSEHVYSRLLPIFGILIFGLLIVTRLSEISSAWAMRKPVFSNDSGISLFFYMLDSPNLPRQRAETLVAELEDNAIVFSDWSEVYSYCYVAYLEKGRTNMDFYEAYPQANGLPASTADYISSNIGLRPVYFTVKPYGPQANKFVFKQVARGDVKIFEIIREK